MPWELRTWMTLLLLGIIPSASSGGILWLKYSMMDARIRAEHFEWCIIIGFFANFIAPTIFIIGYHELSSRKLAIAVLVSTIFCSIGAFFFHYASVLLALPVYFVLRMLWKMPSDIARKNQRQRYAAIKRGKG